MIQSWPVLPASKYCIAVADGTHDSPKKAENGKYLITSKHIHGREIDFDNAYLISEEDYDKINVRSKVDQWDIIISMIGANCGFCYIERNPIINYTVKNVGLLKTGSKEKAEWLYYYLNSERGKQYLYSVRAGSTQPYISLGELRKMPIPYPEESIRQKACYILSSLDDKIDINTAIIKNLNKQMLMLYNHFFPLDDTENGEKVTLGQVTTNVRKRVGNLDLKVLSAVNSGALQLSEEFFTKQVFSKDISKYIVVEENDFAYNPARINIGSIGINDLGFVGCVSPVYVVIKVDEHYTHFFNMFFKSRRFIDEVKLRATGSVRQSMNYRDFALIPLLYPSRETVLRFNEAYVPMLEQIKKAENEIECLQKIKEITNRKIMAEELDLDQLDV